MRALTVRSPRMMRGGPMLHRYTHSKSGGDNVSPPVMLEDVPSDTQSVALMLVDRDANDFVHWAVVDLPPADANLEEGASGRAMPTQAHELYNTQSAPGYSGPNPPPRSGAHRYELVAYALDTPTLDVDEHADAKTLDKLAREHAIAVGSNYWLYENRQ